MYNEIERILKENRGVRTGSAYNWTMAKATDADLDQIQVIAVGDVVGDGTEAHPFQYSEQVNGISVFAAIVGLWVRHREFIDRRKKPPIIKAGGHCFTIQTHGIVNKYDHFMQIGIYEKDPMDGTF